jgi:hypothetical protein
LADASPSAAGASFRPVDYGRTLELDTFVLVAAADSKAIAALIRAVAPKVRHRVPERQGSAARSEGTAIRTKEDRG